MRIAGSEADWRLIVQHSIKNKIIIHKYDSESHFPSPRGR